jgi:hypothetical protein
MLMAWLSQPAKSKKGQEHKERLKEILRGRKDDPPQKRLSR